MYNFLKDLKDMKKFGIAAYGGLIDFRGKYCFTEAELNDVELLDYIKENGGRIEELSEETVKELER